MRDQLEVSRAEFWDAISAREPVDRPAAVEQPEAVEHESWVISVLVSELHMAAEEIEALTEQEAIDLVHEHWSRKRE